MHTNAQKYKSVLANPFPRVSAFPTLKVNSQTCVHDIHQLDNIAITIIIIAIINTIIIIIVITIIIIVIIVIAIVIIIFVIGCRYKCLPNSRLKALHKKPQFHTNLHFYISHHQPPHLLCCLISGICDSSKLR